MTPLTPFQFPFMLDAFAIGALVAVPTALLSCLLVLRGWALMGDAVSHAILPGVVLAYITGAPLIAGAFAAGMGCALLTGFVDDNSRIKRDTVMGVVFSGFFGLGLVLFAAFPSDMHLDQILFGNLLGVSERDLWQAGAISALVGGWLILSWRDLALHAFDPAHARAAGLRVGWLHYGLLAAIAATVVAVLNAVGLILAVALLITPGAVGFLAARRMGGMIVVAIATCLGGLLGGTYLSFFIGSAPAPTVVLVLTAAFLLAFAARRIATARATRA
ncbi:MAG: metal ABC transporter permease [Paracoccaceae bacterium]